MFCHRCGNQLPEDSTFCNRCGAQIRPIAERVRRPSIPLPPPRPPRRYPVIENRPVESFVEETEEEEDEEIYEDEVYPEDVAPGYDEIGDKIIFRVNQTFYPVAFSYLLSILASLAVAAIVGYLGLSYWTVVVCAIIFFIPSIIKHIKLTFTFYTLTPTKIEIQRGILSKIRRNVPLRHIQDVSVSETFKERLLGIGDIIIDTAASASTIRLDNIHDPRMYADMILEQMHRRN
jgi:membrane protein YdbS with pleckstrin-like domain